MWCGAADVEAVESGKMVGPGGKMVPAAKAHPIARALREGDEVAGFTVLDTPGHSPGHVSYWRESDRTLVCGDVMWGTNPFLMRGGIREPFTSFSPDRALNRESARRIAALEPALVCFGHGRPVRDPAISPPRSRSWRADRSSPPLASCPQHRDRRRTARRSAATPSGSGGLTGTARVVRRPGSAGSRTSRSSCVARRPEAAHGRAPCRPAAAARAPRRDRASPRPRRRRPRRPRRPPAHRAQSRQVVAQRQLAVRGRDDERARARRRRRARARAPPSPGAGTARRPRPSRRSRATARTAPTSSAAPRPRRALAP